VSGADVPVLARDSLAAGARVPGPAIVAELDATTWIEPGATATVDPSGALIVEV
jgi:N-methylhydantoinase A